MGLLLSWVQGVGDSSQKPSAKHRSALQSAWGALLGQTKGDKLLHSPSGDPLLKPQWYPYLGTLIFPFFVSRGTEIPQAAEPPTTVSRASSKSLLCELDHVAEELPM